jgi:ribonuclease G
LRREILVSASSQETWVALLEDRQLVELMFDRPDQGRLVGDIYLGRVEAVLPGIQAAFVDIGTEKAGFLHVSDLNWDEDEEENGGGGNRRSRKFPPIQDVVQKGQEILVQVTKEPIGTKGPRLTAQVSLPGRFLVYMPHSSHVGVSRKIDDRGERGRLRKLAKQILPPDSGGMIVRTVGEELTQDTFKKEFKRLREQWLEIDAKAKESPAPSLVRREAKLISGLIRDLFSAKFDAITIEGKDTHQEVVQYVRSVDPDLLGRVKLYSGDEPLFDAMGVQDEIQRAFRRRVGLPSGGYIIIEPTEALVSIDVNTGRFTGKKKKDPEHTILKTNLDAAKEIARQLRLRDIGGIIVCDFIDMDSQENRERVLHELRSHLGRDRARTKAFAVSELGLVEMTRQRVRPSLFQALTAVCHTCGGTGRIFTPATVARTVERTLKRVVVEGKEKRVVVRLHPEVALHLVEEEPNFLNRVSRGTRLKLEVRDDPLLKEDEYRLLAGPAETDVTERYAEAGAG